MNLAATARQLLEEKKFSQAQSELIILDDDDQPISVCIIALLAMASGITVDYILEMDDKYGVTDTTINLASEIDTKVGCKLLSDGTAADAENPVKPFVVTLYELNDDDNVSFEELLDMVENKQKELGCL